MGLGLTPSLTFSSVATALARLAPVSSAAAKSCSPSAAWSRELGFGFGFGFGLGLGFGFGFRFGFGFGFGFGLGLGLMLGLAHRDELT